MNKLELTQRWLTSIIIRPGKLQDKIAAADRNYAVQMERMIRPSELLAPENRIYVYAQGYLLRLMECMRADYPLLLRFLGDELFSAFAKAYLMSLPSHSPSLYDLGAHFPEFLKASQPNNTDRYYFNLPVELAYAERLWAEVERERGLEDLKNEVSDDPLFYFSTMDTLAASPCLRLMEAEFELADFILRLAKDEKAAVPVQRKNFIAICRKNYRVHIHELESWQYYYLQALQACESSAVKMTVLKSGIPEEQLMADLLLWLPTAMDLGFLYSNTDHQSLF